MRRQDDDDGDVNDHDIVSEDGRDVACDSNGSSIYLCEGMWLYRDYAFEIHEKHLACSSRRHGN